MAIDSKHRNEYLRFRNESSMICKSLILVGEKRMCAVPTNLIYIRNGDYVLHRA